jgi:glucosamine--fructose-6-phosphate aminotransferase (isomerizing)
VKTVQAHSGAAELGPYRHYMQKEIFEQPRAIADTLVGVDRIVPSCLKAVPARLKCSMTLIQC